ncbi:MAG: hypothetical protein QM648_08440 [Solirubrobacterales bacterium]
MSETEQNAPASEEEIREGVDRIKSAIRFSVLISTPLLILIAWLADLSSLAWLVVGVIVAYEIISYPFIMRMLDRGQARQIEELRAKQGLTPASQLPDVGV